MGAFTDQDLMKQIIDKILYKIHSTGMNEQELLMLVFYKLNKKLQLEFFVSGSIDEGDVLEDDMSTNGLISKVIKLIGLLTKNDQKSFERYLSY